MNEYQLCCWILSDGTPGMKFQATALATAMGLNAEVKCITPHPLLRVSPLFACLPGFPIAVSGTKHLIPPWPDILITCGRRHAGASIALKRQSSRTCFTIHIQDPRISPTLFDVLIVPKHDPTRGNNVITTTCSLTGVNDDLMASEAKHFAQQVVELPRPLVAVNLGGDTRQHRVNKGEAAALVNKLEALADTTRCGLLVTTSRRSGPALIAALAPLGERADTVLWTGTGPNPYLGYLGLADFVIVTTDSINMISDACASGKPVYLIALGTNPTRRTAFVSTIREKGLARPFDGILEAWDTVPLREVDRVASLLRTQIRKLSSFDRT